MNTSRVDRLLTVPLFGPWLMRRDPRERYNYIDSNDCLIARYLTEKGLEDVTVGPWHVDIGMENYVIPDDLQAIAHGTNSAPNWIYTMGGAQAVLTRLYPEYAPMAVDQEKELA